MTEQSNLSLGEQREEEAQRCQEEREKEKRKKERAGKWRV